MKVGEGELEGERKRKVGKREVSGGVKEGVGEGVRYYVEEDGKEGKEIVEKVKEFCGRFMGFGGGWMVEGVNEERMYEWKKRVGGIENGGGEWRKWGGY